MPFNRPLLFAHLESRLKTTGAGPARLRYTFRSSVVTQSNLVAPFHASARQLQDDNMAERPTGLKANKGIELLTFGTPNGHKASIILEELKEAYGKDYTW